ncbi:MAG: glycosyltransferase family 39 protein [Chloroflexota bacterium]
MRAEQRPTPRISFNPSRLALVAILVVAGFLRFYRLDAQSFWNDEGNAARIAERSLDLIVEGAAGDIHPPGYYLLLHYWRAAFGQSEFALRSLSVVAGLGLVAVIYLLGRRLYDETTGLIAAFLGAISPFAVYYAQEVRMYALLGALSALSSLLVARILQPTDSRSRGGPSLGAVAAYVGVSAAGLYTHYAFLFVVVAHSVAFGAWWLAELLGGRPRWRSLAAWAGAQGTVFLLYLPWLPTAVSATGWSAAGGDYQLGAALLDVLRVLTVGVTLPLGEAGIALVAGGLLFLLGLIPGAERDGGWGRSQAPEWIGTAGLLITLLVPLALFFGFDLYKPAWLKFLVVILPPFHILVARGVKRLGDLVSRGLPTSSGASPSEIHVLRFTPYAVVLVAFAALTYLSLRNLYYNPAYFRDDYRQLAADIQAIRRPGDAIVLNAPNQWEVFTYYYPDEDVYPAPYRPDEGRAERFLTPILQEHQRLFVLYWGDAEADPQKRVESWLAEHAYKAGDRWYGSVRLATYGVAPLPERPHRRIDARFGRAPGDLAVGHEGLMRLRGYAVAVDGSFSPGDIVPVTLFWAADGSIEEPYKVTVQLLDDEGGLAAQVDTVPGDGLAPTTTWQEGQVLVDRYGIHLPPDLSPGRYSLVVAVYDAVGGERLSVSVDGEHMGDHVELSHVTVETG